MTLPFLGGGGGESYLRSDFLEGRVTKILNFALKIKGGGRESGTCEVLQPCHPPPPKKKLERAHSLQVISSAYFDLKFVLTSIMNVLILNTN